MRPSLLPYLLIVLAGSACAQTATLPYADPRLPPAQRAADLVGRLTLEEKISEMRNTSAAVPRLGIPEYNWWNEGLHGVARSGYATLFPQAIGMAATWDAPLIQREGDTIATEARAKNADALRHGNHSIYYGLTFWSPNINIFRDPRWGRGQETYGEDPYLTSRLGVSFVEGMQGNNPDFYKVIATPKHFAVHSGPESERHRFDVKPSPHDLWDTYLPAFRATITEARAGSVMCAYNAIEGQPACGSDLLMQTVLRGYWNFQGFVTSDCGAVDDFYEKTAHHTSVDRAHGVAAALLHGTDTECGDSYQGLGDALHQGLLTEADIDVSLRRLFLARIKLGLFDDPAIAATARNPYAAVPMSEVGSPAHHALALEAANKSMVLLKNDGILPLVAGKYKTIAVIGPNAASLAAIEGNYNAIPRDPVMPLDALKAQFPGSHILYAQGAPYAEGVSVPAPRTLFHPAQGVDGFGLKAEYFAKDDFTGAPVLTRTDPAIDFDWTAASPEKGVPQEAFAVRWTGTITPPQPGAYSFSVDLASCYPCEDSENVEVLFDGKRVAQASTSSSGESRPSGTPRFNLTFGDAQPHNFTVLYRHKSPLFGAGLALVWYPSAAVLQQEALHAASQADLVVAIAGLSPNLEGEEMPVHVEGFAGGDRTDIILPKPQQDLLEAVASTGKPMVLVLLNGSALAVNWAQQHAHAILEAWYPGEAGAEAIAQTLAGENNPAGRLPVTFYRSVADLPAFTDYSMRNRTYRYTTAPPLYRFGYGLSYSHFVYQHLKLSTTTLQAGESLTAEADVKNAGSRAGEEVAELYLLPPAQGNGGLSPRLSLQGFQRFRLSPGESRHVIFHLDPRSLSQVDAAGNRVVQPGAYSLALGGSQPGDENAAAPALTAPFNITGTQELLH